MSRRTAQRRIKKFVAEGNEKADEVAKEGNAEGGRGGICSFAVCREFSLFGVGMEGL